MKNRPKTEWPNIGAPAQRTLDREDIISFAKLKKFTEAELLALHGIGPKAVGILRDTMKKKGISFKK